MRSVLITGCSTGIGRYIAEALSAKGYRVFASARRLKDIEELKQKGIATLQIDVENSESIRKGVDFVLEQTDGRLYGLFNNAGYGQAGAVEDISRDLLRQQFETNLFGLHELTNLVLPTMRKYGEGRIIQHSSVLGLVAMKYRGAYNASKFAIEGLTDTLRQELQGSGIYVSLIDTGPVTSNFRKNSLLAFKRNIDMENSVHRETYQAVLRRLESEDNGAPFTLGPEAVFKKVVLALESKKPKARYYVTIPTHAFAFLKRVLPGWALDCLLIKAAGAENK